MLSTENLCRGEHACLKMEEARNAVRRCKAPRDLHATLHLASERNCCPYCQRRLANRPTPLPPNKAA
jgi:hypothetical protein